MTDYDNMSVEELLDEMDSDVVEGYPRDTKKVFALRNAVVKEASVGMVSTYTTLDGPEENEYIKTDWTIKGDHPEDGTFNLVPVLEA